MLTSEDDSKGAIMTGDGLLVMLVPGRDDRAFYKRLFNYIARKLGFQVIDLDSRDYMREKIAVLDRICRQQKHFMSREEQGNVLRGASIVKLFSAKGRGAYVAIVPCERRVTQIASLILGYQAGQLDGPSIDFIVVADDAEEMDFIEKLRSLYNSLRSLSYFEMDKNVSAGEYYYLYVLRRPKGVKLMVFVQGLRQVTIVTKHAIEDYIFFTYMDMVNEIMEAIGMCPQLINMDILESHMHKKLALLVALKLCYTRIEELFLKGLNDNRLDKLLQVCDGLNVLARTIASMLGM